MTTDPGPGTGEGASGHVATDRLADAALEAGEPGQVLEPAERRHLADCSVCRYEYDALRRVAELSEDSDAHLSELIEPEPELWARIEVELASDPGVGPSLPSATAARAVEAPGEPPGQAPVVPVASPRVRRRRVLLGTAAALVGVLVGVGGTLGVQRWTEPTAEVVARTELAALPGEQGSGQAELVRVDGQLRLRVVVVAAATPQSFHQLWLINTDGKQMYDLGTLPPSGNGSYAIPAALADGLGDYRIVDVSIQPNGGNPAHSHHSLVRGQLPS